MTIETMNLAGITELSTIDYANRSAIIVFFGGCNFNCCYCHNHQIIGGGTEVPISDAKKAINRSIGFVSAVVFSGGEATLQPEQLIELATYAKTHDLKVGVHTNGYQPEVIKKLIELNLVDRVFMDIKTSLTEPYRYYDLIRVKLPHVFENINKTLIILLESDVDVEIRTTVFVELHTPADIINIMNHLSHVKTFFDGKREFMFTVQIGRKKDGSNCEKIFDIDELKRLISINSFNFSEIKI